MNIAIILAGGTGTRVGAGRPKQFIEVLGKPVLAYTCEIFQENKRIDAIEVVCHHDWIDYCKEMVEQYKLSKVKWIIPGGETFQDSVMNGMNYLKELLGQGVSPDDNIYIQYGGAPFTSQKIVDAVIDMTEERGSAVTGTPCYQLMALKNDDDNTRTSTWIDRDKYTQIACPYGFRFSYLLDVYKRAEEQGLIDKIEPHTTSLMFALGDTINLAYGDQTNIKITTKEDIEMFEGYVLIANRKKRLANHRAVSYQERYVAILKQLQTKNGELYEKLSLNPESATEIQVASLIRGFHPDGLSGKCVMEGFPIKDGLNESEAHNQLDEIESLLDELGWE